MTLIRRAILAFALIAGLSPAFAQAPAPVPALPDTERRTTYSITGSTCACAVGFQLYGDSTDVANWIEVFVNGALVTQSGNWNLTSPSGSIATLARPITDAVLTFTVAQTGTVQIVGARRPRRTSQFSENAGVSARNLNQAITDLVAMLRENWDKTNDVTGRAVLAPPGETLALLPILASRQNQGACFNSSGNLTACAAIPSGSFAAGNGILFTGTGPTTISANIQAGSGITITGTNPLVISAPPSSISFTQTGTGAVAQTIDQLLRQKVYTPEMFGATPSPQGTAAGSVVNNQTQVQAAINALQAINGGTLLFGPGVYGIGPGITAGSNIIIRGTGIHSTTLLYQPTGVGTAVTFTNGAITSNVGISDLSINSADTTLVKTGLAFVDVSQCFMTNVMISAYQTGYWTSSTTAIGLNTMGRELCSITNNQIYAQLPIEISNNPHVAGGTEDLDSWTFTDLILVSDATAATHNVIAVDNGVAMFNVRFNGHQNWIGGIDAFHWVSTGAAASFGLYISGVKDEQAGSSAGVSINIQPAAGIFGVHIGDSQIGGRGGIKLRQVKNAFISNVIFDPSTSTNKVGLDADLTNSLIDFRANTWLTGTLAVLGAFTGSAPIAPAGFSSAIPSSGVLYQ